MSYKTVMWCTVSEQKPVLPWCSCNKITCDGMVFWAGIPKSNTTLEVIDLSFNTIENAGAKNLSESLATYNRSLKELSVVSNKLREKDLLYFHNQWKQIPNSNIYIWGSKFNEATCVWHIQTYSNKLLQSDNTVV